MSVVCRGVRGATTATSNDRDEVLTATRQLLALMIRLNDIDSRDVTSAIFSTTRDLDC
ncbi:MAG: chorismate mutase, partial [Proteobacteria bacterium]|nr:chorismate mutase [Pseudomonadota bacterium]